MMETCFRSCSRIGTDCPIVPSGVAATSSITTSDVICIRIESIDYSLQFKI